jgi:hypothetical protein
LLYLLSELTAITWKLSSTIPHRGSWNKVYPIQVSPENRMIVMASQIELDGFLQLRYLEAIILSDGIAKVFLGLVQVVDISLSSCSRLLLDDASCGGTLIGLPRV